MEDLIQKFCNKNYLKQKHPSLKPDVNPKTKRKFVFIDDLMIIIRFLGFVKFECNRPNARNHVFVRGQTDDFNNMIPSIFRGDNLTGERIRKRLEAYKKVKCEIYQIKPAARFKGEIGGASLQHYGLKTPWLDLVDNIFIGLWFARNEMNFIKENIYEIKKSKNEFGWIYLLRAEYENKVNSEGICIGANTQWCDLRYHHRDLSLRPHFQHGIFISKSNYSDINYDLNNEIIATIKLPLKLKNDIEDVKSKHIFPSKRYDNTYKYLTNPKVNAMIAKVENDFQLNNKELGRIFTIKEKNDS
ncbi:MAG: hypothetical protein CV087_23705 [Candidatus Brocadia sp. WS118]|nr:MAG: hypothetical protein CV087_23705 [Candidatus Brocadia sp. WS118]